MCEFRPEPEKKKPAPRRRAAAKKPAPEPDDMEESDDDSSSDEEEFDMDMENLDQNQLIKDEEDRKYLDSLNQLEREAILADRFEQRKKEHDMKVALREQKRIERELKRGQKAPKKKTVAKKGSKKDTSKDEEVAQRLSSRRSSTRDRDATKKKEAKNKALAALREVSITKRLSSLRISCNLELCNISQDELILISNLNFTGEEEANCGQGIGERVRLWG